MPTEGNQTILVVAPQFPAINQPWIETYLESLIAASFDVSIFTAVENPQYVSAKVQKLNLLEKTVSFQMYGLKDRISLIRSRKLPELKAMLKAVRASLQLCKGDLKDAFAAWINTLCLIAINSKQVHVIHSHDESLSYAFLFLARVKRIPLIVTFHGLPPHGVAQLSRKKRMRLYENVTRVLVNTNFAKGQVCSLGCPPDKVTVLPQGLPISDFPYHLHTAPLPGEDLKILTVGRFHRDKGQIYALLALRRLLNAGIQATWTFVGIGPDLERLKIWTSRLGLDEQTYFYTGLSLAELNQLYQTNHLFVLPSVESPNGHVETQGVVLQEAQASGCVPIASRIGGIPECLNKEDSILVKQRRSREIAEAITFLLRSPDHWEQMQDMGRKNVEKNFSAQVVGGKMASILFNTIHEHSRALSPQPAS